MTKEKPSFFSFDGEMGRIDYWASSLFRSLIGGLIFFVILAVIFRGYFSSSYQELSTAITQWTSDHAVRVWMLGEILYIFLFLPITWRRWRDLGPRLKKNWLYISVASSLMPGYEVFPLVGMQSLIITLGILAIYPNFKLFFWPGKQYANLSQSKQP